MPCQRYSLGKLFHLLTIGYVFTQLKKYFLTLWTKETILHKATQMSHKGEIYRACNATKMRIIRLI